MQKFAIISPEIQGLAEHIPNIFLNKAWTPDNENVRMSYGAVERVKLRLKELVDASYDKVATTDGFPIIHYHLLTKNATGATYLYGFTKAHIYRWNTTTKTWGTAVHTCASDCTNWESVTYADQVIATNNVDKVITEDGSGSFTVLGAASGLEYATGEYLTKAKYIAVFEGYLVLGYTTENGTIYPQRIRWSDLGDETDWNTGDAGSNDTGTGDFLIGLKRYKDFLIIFRTDSIDKMWLVTSDDVFNISEISTEIGCLSSQSIVSDKDGMLFYLASDKVIRDLNMTEISTAIDPTIKLINPTYYEGIRATYIKEFGEIWWAIPYGNSATANNLVITRSKEGNWSFQDLSIYAFGSWDRQVIYTYDTIPFSTFDSWGWDFFDTVESIAGFALDIGSDADGYTYALHGNELDDTTAYTGYFVLSTDLTDGAGLPFYKRLLHMQPIIKKESAGTLNFYIKRDNEADWQSVGSVVLTGNSDIMIKDLPCDLRAKHFLIKVEGDTRFRFLGGFFDFYLDGGR